MKILDILEEKYSEYNWELKSIGKQQFTILCNNIDTEYKFYDFEKMFLPVDEEAKKRMTRENIEIILKKIEDRGFKFLEEEYFES